MRRTDSIRLAFDYLVERAKDGTSFTVADLAQATKWTPGTTKINLTKKFSELILKDGSEYRASPELFRVRYADFKDLFRQKQRLFTDYIQNITPNVLVYEFFMPLAREDRLREILDSLFFTDAIENRVKEIGVRKIRSALKLPENISDAKVTRFVCDFIDNTIGGYSLYLVSGRFRADKLISRTEAAQRPFAEGPYLVDETTAVVRFILPVTVEEINPRQDNLFEPAQPALDANEKAEQMRWLFLNFFAEAVTRVVRNEDEIWLVETGMRSALYKWIKKEE